MRGREAERRAVGDLLRRARDSHGGVVLVEGEPGIGKSSLLRDSADRAVGAGFSLVADAADQAGAAIPFSARRPALGESLAGLIAEASGDGLPASLARWTGLARTRLEQRSAAAPVLVCLDDLQWGSATTLAALRVLPRELRRHPVAWILARSGIPRKEPEHLFDILASDGAARLGLSPLTGEEGAAILADAFGAPPDPGLRTLAAGAAGNPRLLSELIAGLREEGAVRVADGRAVLAAERLPERMRKAARQRIDGVSEQARLLLMTAAVLGSSFRLGDAAEMLGTTPAVLLPAVEETMTAGITIATETAFSFRHRLLRRGLHDMVPPPDRRALHRKYGLILLNRGEPTVAAGHLKRAADRGDPASLADLDAAAERTLRSAPRTAAALASRALELTFPADREAVPRAVAAAETLAAAGRLDQAGRIARDLLAKPLPPAAEARLRCVLSWVLCSRGEARGADGEARAALALPGLPLALRDDVTAARLRALAGRRDEAAVSLAGTVIAAPDRHGRHVVVAAMAAAAAANWEKGQAGAAVGLLRDAARLETAASPDARRDQPLLALAAALAGLRQLEEAELLLDAADSPALRATPAQAAASIVRARIHLAHGRLPDAAAAAGRALAIAHMLGARGYASAARCVLGAVALRGGDAVSAARHVGGVIAGPHAGEAYMPAAVILAQISEAREGLAHAVTRIRHACGDLAARPGLLLGDPAAAAWLTRTALAAGDTELATAVTRTAAALADGNPGYPAISAAAGHALGLVSRDPVPLAEAAAAQPDPWSRASASEDLGRLHAARHDNDIAIRHLVQAADGYAGTGAGADVARVRGRLRKLGVRHRDWARQSRRPAAGWESLTDAERSAAELVAKGLNNAQVSDQMYVSVHTVAFYMRQAFRKLGVSSRVELARVVIEQSTAGGRRACGEPG